MVTQLHSVLRCITISLGSLCYHIILGKESLPRLPPLLCLNTCEPQLDHPAWLFSPPSTSTWRCRLGKEKARLLSQSISPFYDFLTILFSDIFRLYYWNLISLTWEVRPAALKAERKTAAARCQLSSQELKTNAEPNSLSSSNCKKKSENYLNGRPQTASFRTVCCCS